ncbi:MAG: DUF4270 domain-containing protein [Salinivirgaceae bacterium]|nr:DUF4270 domain-containing protein [Salinivirgaceae bacterium]
MNTKFFLFIILSNIILFFSCVDDTETYKVGNVFTEKNSKITYVDSFTVNAYTIARDSFVSSSYNKVFLGYNNDEYLGKTTAISYMTLGYEDNLPSLDKKTRFDSIVLVLKQNGDYLGDTMVAKKFSVYRVTDSIALSEDAYYFYNIDSFAHENTPIATHTFIPRPLKNKVEYVRFPDSLGQAWLDWIIKDTVITTSSKFISHFKGLVLIPDTKDQSWSTSFYGLNSSDSYTEESFNQVELRIYYKVPEAETNSYFAFIPVDNYIFSHFTSDRSGTVSSILETGEGKIPSSQTDSKVFMQAGSGTGIKIDIPQIEWMYELGSNITVLDAKLIMRPTSGTFKKASSLPDNLSVYWTDKKNRNQGSLYDLDGETVISGYLKYDDEFNQDTYYTFSVLSFVIDKMESDEINNNTLMFYLSEESIATSFDKLIIDDQSASNNSFELQIYYYTY